MLMLLAQTTTNNLANLLTGGLGASALGLLFLFFIGLPLAGWLIWKFFFNGD